MPSFRELPASTTGHPTLVSPEKCKQFPERVLFYIFYSAPHDRSQLNAATELEKRGWTFIKESMRWKKTSDGKTVHFNPQLWKEQEQ
mmetsp:Transcript_14772/g.22900  ORF Transcript_14772/g.22900 Transcript_14772/m.22900 type:complete len:87 (-) Transcript_14772:140-400(-)